jgi:hypothetical protein
MLNIQRKTDLVARLAATAVLSLGFAATGTLSAFADYGPASQSPSQTQAQVRSWHAYPYATNRVELAYPELARQFGSDPGHWPSRAFRNIDCDLPSSGCPTNMSVGQ